MKSFKSNVISQIKRIYIWKHICIRILIWNSLKNKMVNELGFCELHTSFSDEESWICCLIWERFLAAESWLLGFSVDAVALVLSSTVSKSSIIITHTLNSLYLSKFCLFYHPTLLSVPYWWRLKVVLVPVPPRREIDAECGKIILEGRVLFKAYWPKGPLTFLWSGRLCSIW